MDSAQAPSTLLLIGVVGKPHGLDGGVYVLPFNPASPLWAPGTGVLVVPADRVGTSSQDTVVASAATGRLEIRDLGLGAKERLVCFLSAPPGARGRGGGPLDRDGCEALRGAYLAVPVDALDEPGDDEFFFHEVKGWAVEDLAGTPLGTVVDVVETYVELLEVRPTVGREHVFVPVIGGILARIDRPGRRLVLDPPEGLFP